jgi:arsenate reductase (thioredoxin)
VALAMKEVGIDISKNRPKLLTLEMMDSADRAIVMGCGDEQSCPAAVIPLENWELEDPEGQPLEKVRAIRDEVARRVRKLVADIESPKKLVNTYSEEKHDD